MRLAIETAVLFMCTVAASVLVASFEMLEGDAFGAAGVFLGASWIDGFMMQLADIQFFERR